MADIAKHTILWNGDQSEITSMDRWDAIDEDQSPDDYEEPRQPRQLVFY